jgi:hypothetical protein
VLQLLNRTNHNGKIVGNHAAGIEMGLDAEIKSKSRVRTDSALELLDAICEPYKNFDVEFEYANEHFNYLTDPHPYAALGMLIVEAFAPNGLNDLDRYSLMISSTTADSALAEQRWNIEVYKPFKNRYGFC